MSVQYVPVIWNRNKMIYDAVLIVAVVLYIYLYLRLGPMFQDVTRPIDGAVLRMQAFGTCAFLMLTVILCLGPLARFDKRFLPLVYNRRHFGVLTAGVAAVHATYVLGWYYAFSPVDRYAALFGANTSYGQLIGFPFEIFGVLALVILLVLAATSHDFWLNFLTPPIWKTLHMLIYLAFASVSLHIALGPLQSGDNPVFAGVAAMSILAVSGLHFAAARREAAIEAKAGVSGVGSEVEPNWVRAGLVSEIQENRAITVILPDDERVAIFKYKGKLSAVTNACAHQNGPLGEGKIIGGCITCPWHGYQYRPEDGRSPAPFTEKIATYRLKLDGETILLDPKANPPGTRVEPVLIGGDA